MPKTRVAKPSPETTLGDLRLTHPDRVIDASRGVTKRQVAEYYAQVAPWILPQLKDRPVALVRAPEGLGGELFFQKNAGQLHIPDVVSYSKAQAGQAAMILNSAESLLGAVQMNMLELHTRTAPTRTSTNPIASSSTWTRTRRCLGRPCWKPRN